MTPHTRLASLPATVLLALLATACTGGGADPAGDPSPADAGAEVAVVERPHFEGERTVALAAGQPAVGVGEGGCRDDNAPYWVCDREKATSYLAVGEGTRVAMREARMDVAGGGTSWTVTLRFAGPDRQALASVAEEARGRGAVVLVLDESREVLVAASVEDVDRGAIHLSGLTKPEAWDTVEQLASG